MEFCEKCGALMLPKKSGDKQILKCRECGHEKPIKSAPAYKVEYRIKHTPREKIVVVENEGHRNEEISEDERRERRKAILEHFSDEE